jgi:hypothetical protein
VGEVYADMSRVKQVLSEEDQQEQAKKVTQLAKRGRGQPKRWETAEQLQTAIDGYWEWLEAQPVVLSLRTGLPVRRPAYWGRLLLHIGMSKSTVAPYFNGDYDDGAEGALRYSEVLARAKLLCETDLAEGAAMGIYDAKSTAGTLEHYHEHAQKHEVTGANGGPIEFKGALDEWSK